MAQSNLEELVARIGIPPYEQRIEAIRAVTELASKGEDISAAIPRLYEIGSDPDYEPSVDSELHEAAMKAIGYHLINTQAWGELERRLQNVFRSGERLALLSALAGTPKDISPVREAVLDILSGRPRPGYAWSIQDRTAAARFFLAAEDETIRSAAMSRLIDSLSSEDEVVRHSAAASLVPPPSGTDLSRAVPALTQALHAGDLTLTWYAASALLHAASTGADIASAVPALERVLSYQRPEGAKRTGDHFEDEAWRPSVYDDPFRFLEPAVSEAAAALSRQFANTNQIARIEELLLHKEADVKFNAARELACHYVEKEEWANVQALLERSDIEVRRGTTSGVASGLERAAEGVGVSGAIRALEQALSDEDERVRSVAVAGFERIAAAGRIDISSAVPALAAALADEGKYMREGVLRTLQAYALSRKRNAMKKRM